MLIRLPTQLTAREILCLETMIVMTIWQETRKTMRSRVHWKTTGKIDVMKAENGL